MRSLPSTWPLLTGPDVEVPQATVTLVDASWPPATGTLPAGTGRCSSWSVRRELSAFLPGQVRGASGASVASGTAVVDQVEDARVLPWRMDARRVSTGASATIELRPSGTGDALRLGRFVVDGVDGGARSSSVTLALLEDVGSTAGAVSIPTLLDPTGRTTIDAVWLIDQAARRLGYHATPRPGPGTVASVPLQGSVYPELGSPLAGWLIDPQATKWVSREGKVWASAVGPASVQVAFSQAVRGTLPPDLFVTLDLLPLADAFSAESAILSFGTAAGATAGAFGVWLSPSRVGLLSSSVAFTPAGSAVHPRRLQVQVNALSLSSVRVRARSGPAVAWSSWQTVPLADPFVDPALGFVTVTLGRSGDMLRALHVSTVDDPAAWEPETASLEPSGVILSAVFAQTVAPWTLVQDVADGTLGSAWVDGAGVLTYRGRDAMRGVRPVTKRLDLDAGAISDLQWKVSRDDVADRVELTYRPPAITTVTDGSLTVWQATEKIAVGGGKTVTVVAELGAGAVAQLAGWSQDTVTGGNATTGSRWLASASADGSTTLPPATALQITATLVSPTQARITIRNTTSSTLWLVDGTGAPWLILRANVTAAAGEALIVAVGEPAETAQRVKTLDVSAVVQDAETAAAMASWLYAGLVEPTALLTDIEVPLDLTIELGDVWTVTAPGAGIDDATSKVGKALVTAVDLEGDDTGIRQTVSLVLTSTTFADLDVVLATGAASWAGLDAMWSAQASWAQLDRWITIEGIPE